MFQKFKRLINLLLLFQLFNHCYGQTDFSMHLYESDIKDWALQENSHLKQLICNSVINRQLPLYSNELKPLDNTTIDSFFKMEYSFSSPVYIDFYTITDNIILHSIETNIKNFTFSSDFVYIHHNYFKKTFTVKKSELIPILNEDQFLFLSLFYNEINNEKDSFKSVSELVYFNLINKIDQLYLDSLNKAFRITYVIDTVFKTQVKRHDVFTHFKTILPINHPINGLKNRENESTIITLLSDYKPISKILPIKVFIRNDYPLFSINLLSSCNLTNDYINHNMNVISDNPFLNYNSIKTKFSLTEKQVLETIVRFKMVQKTKELFLNKDDFYHQARLFQTKISNKIYQSIKSKSLKTYLPNGKAETFEMSMKKIEKPYMLENCLPKKIKKRDSKQITIHLLIQRVFKEIKNQKEFTTLKLNAQYPCEIRIKTEDLFSILDSNEIAFLKLYQLNEIINFDSFEIRSSELVKNINAKIFIFSQLETTPLYKNDSFISKFSNEEKNRALYCEEVVFVPSTTDLLYGRDSVVLKLFDINLNPSEQQIKFGINIMNDKIESTWISTYISTKYCNKQYGYLPFFQDKPLNEEERLILESVIEYKIKYVLKI